MCGIIGINEKNEALVRDSAACFSYRGPDATAFWSDSAVTLGHHRLSIIDLDPRSTQPMADDRKEVWVVFNGEIYNFKPLRAELEKHYQFRTGSDTEVLIYAYKEWGTGMFDRIQGMYALAIYDVPEKKVVIARDHRGIKPLYYYAKDGVFIFASELKGVTRTMKAKGISLELDRRSVDLFEAFGYVPSPRTIFKDVSKSPKRSFIEYDLATKELSDPVRYDPEFQTAADETAYAELIERKILDHLIADVPVGVFFSGGTDSSLIASVLHKHGIDLETFSIHMDYKSDDQKYFQEISKHLKLKSHESDFGEPEFEEVYEEVMSKMDEPTYDNSIFPTYFVSKKASEKVKVVLSGEGGDEFFYGYPRSEVLYGMREGKDDRITLLDRLYFASPSFRMKNRLFEKLFIALRRPYSYYLLSMSPSRDRGSLSAWRAAKEEFRKNGTLPMQLDQEFYLENDLLRKTDAATSYVSIEGRVPLLDIDVTVNAPRFEAEHLRGAVLKSLLKRFLCAYLPKELVYRRKSGFGMDMRKYFKSCERLRKDLDAAVPYLRGQGIRVAKASIGSLIERYPNYCFALVSLYRSVRNCHE